MSALSDRLAQMSLAELQALLKPLPPGGFRDAVQQEIENRQHVADMQQLYPDVAGRQAKTRGKA